MTRTAGVGLLTTMMATLAIHAQTAAPQQTPVFRAGANFVYVDVYPRQDGRVVEGLTLDDFEIIEDGKPQKAETLQFVSVEPTPEAARRDPNNTREMLQLVADPTNRAFVVFLDYLHVSVEGSYRLRQPLVNALNQIGGPRDLFAIATTGQRPDHLVFGRRSVAIEDQLTRFWPWGQRHQIGTDPLDPGEVQMEACFQMTPPKPGRLPEEWFVSDEDGARIRLDRLMIDRRREDRSLSSLEAFVDYLGRVREARTVMVIVSDGWRLFGRDRALVQAAAEFDVAPPGVGVVGGQLTPATAVPGVVSPATCTSELLRLADLDHPQRLRDLIARANRSNVSLYPVTPAGLSVFDTPISRPIEMLPGAGSALAADRNRISARVGGLRTLAENTDGIAIVETNDLARGLERIVDDVSAYYLVGYYSTNTARDGRYRRIEVRLRRPDIDVKARRGYLAPDASAAPIAAPADGLPAEAEAALGALGRLRPDAELFMRPGIGDGAIWVAAELGRSGRAKTWATTGAAVRVDVTTDAGQMVGEWTGAIAPMTRGALAKIALPTGSTGPWRVTVTIGDGVDRLQDQIGVETPAAAGPLGAPMLFRATPSARSALYAVADSQFRRTERLHVEWPIHAPLDRRDVRLLGRDGKPLPVPVTVTERDVDGAPRLAADVNLAPLAEGEYFIELTASAAGGQPVRSFVAVKVTR